MPRVIILAGLAAASVAVLIAAPATSNAACSDRKAVGTVLGGVGGALLGNSISKGGGGAVVGGLGGAVIGHQIAKSGCGRSRPVAYRSSGGARASNRARAAYAPAPVPVRYVYYDQYGNPVSSGPAPIPAGQYGSQYGVQPVAFSGSGYCRTEMRSFYNERGLLVQRPMQICDR